MHTLLNSLRNALSFRRARQPGSCPLRFPSKSRQRLGWSRYLCGLGR